MSTNTRDEISVALSKAEAEVYDRQIRLWGLEAQQRLRGVTCLLCGLSGVGAEIVKNLMLCGLRSLVLMDEKVVSRDDLESNFLLECDSIGKNRAKASASRAQALNPMVKLEVIDSELSNVELDFISRFALVVFCDQSYDDVVIWNDRCRKQKVGFIACSVFGWMGYSFFDFNDHLFLCAVKRQHDVCDLDEGEGHPKHELVNLDVENLFEKKVLPYPRYEDAFNVDWSRKQLIRKCRRLIPCSYFPLRAMLRAQKEKKLTNDEGKNVEILVDLWREEVVFGNQEVEKQSVQPTQFDYFFGPQLSSVCAIVGGFAAQEAIKALLENERPLRNMFIYSALDSSGVVCHFPPP